MNNFENVLKSKKGKLVVIFPHPDDESVATGGLLLKAKRFGWNTVVVTLTNGEAGQCYIEKKNKRLSDIRKIELNNAVSDLKVDKLILEDFGDGKLKNGGNKLEFFIKNVLNIEKPDVVVTYDHSGFTGHPDHIQLSVSLLNILRKVNIKTDLYWVSAPRYIANIIFNKQTINGYTEPNYYIGLGIDIFKKLKAILRHKSQDVGNNHVLLYLYLLIFRREWYYKVDLSKKYKYKFVYFKI